MNRTNEFYYHSARKYKSDFYGHHRTTTVVRVEEKPLDQHEQLFQMLGERRASLAKYHTVYLSPEKESLVANLRERLSYPPPLPTKEELLILIDHPDFPLDATAKLLSLFTAGC